MLGQSEQLKSRSNRNEDAGQQLERSVGGSVTNPYLQKLKLCQFLRYFIIIFKNDNQSDEEEEGYPGEQPVSVLASLLTCSAPRWHHPS